MTIEIEGEKGREDAVLGQGELFVVSRYVRHRPIGDAEITLLERVEVVNTEDAGASESTRKLRIQWL
jgi:hypothetical protein